MSNTNKRIENRISVRLPLDKLAMLNDIAKREKTTVSKLVQSAITAKFREVNKG